MDKHSRVLEHRRYRRDEETAGLPNGTICIVIRWRSNILPGLCSLLCNAHRSLAVGMVTERMDLLPSLTASFLYFQS